MGTLTRLTLILVSLSFLPAGIASPQTGTNLREFPSPAINSGNGRGMAFDGTDLYFTTTSTNLNITKIGTNGNFPVSAALSGNGEGK